MKTPSSRHARTMRCDKPKVSSGVSSRRRSLPGLPGLPPLLRHVLVDGGDPVAAEQGGKGCAVDHQDAVETGVGDVVAVHPEGDAQLVRAAEPAASATVIQPMPFIACAPFLWACPYGAGTRTRCGSPCRR